MQLSRLPSIRAKMTAALILILVPYFIYISYINYSDSKKIITDEITGSILPLASDNIYSDVQADLIRPIFVSSLMANDTFLKDWVLGGEKNVGEIRKYLNTIKNKYGFFSSFFVSNITKKYYYYSGVLKTVSRKDSHDIWFYRFLEKNVPYVIDIDTDQAADNTLTIFLNHRLSDYRDRTIGVTGVGLKMEAITEKLLDYREKYGCEVYFIDSHGVIQAHSDVKMILKSNIKITPGIETVADRILERNTKQELFRFTRNGSDVHIISRYIQEFGWHLIVEIDEGARLSGLKKKTAFNLVMSMVISFIVILIAILTVNYFQKKMAVIATTDELTGTFNRRELDRKFGICRYRLQRSGTDFSLIIIDIDLFKTINDKRGHAAGDSVLKKVSLIARSHIRETDTLFRYGGDEFIILFEGDSAAAADAAKRIGSEISSSDILNDTPGSAFDRITVSCGVSQYCSGESIDDLLEKADRALYRAKDNGRDRTETV